MIGMIVGTTLSEKISAKNKSIKEQNDDVEPWGDGLTIGSSVSLGVIIIGMIGAIAYPGSNKVAMTTFSNNKTLIAFVFILLSLLITIGSFITGSKSKSDDEKNDLYVKLSFYLTLFSSSILFFVLGGLLYNKQISELSSELSSGLTSAKSRINSSLKSSKFEQIPAADLTALAAAA